MRKGATDGAAGPVSNTGPNSMSDGSTTADKSLNQNRRPGKRQPTYAQMTSGKDKPTARDVRTPKEKYVYKMPPSIAKIQEEIGESPRDRIRKISALDKLWKPNPPYHTKRHS